MDCAVYQDFLVIVRFIKVFRFNGIPSSDSTVIILLHFFLSGRFLRDGYTDNLEIFSDDVLKDELNFCFVF
jgi:hypothetical protein